MTASQPTVYGLLSPNPKLDQTRRFVVRQEVSARVFDGHAWSLLPPQILGVSKDDDVNGILKMLPGLSGRAGSATVVSEVVGVDISPVAPTLSAIQERIASSRDILLLEDDWDGEGSPAYRWDTWKRATDFLLENSRKFEGVFGEPAPVPKIWGGPNGSIDMHWTTSDRELLINVPNGDNDLADYYGDDGRRGERIKGFLDPKKPNAWVIAWLTKN